MKLILPKTFVEKKFIVHPLFFLAGPVMGGGNWQAKMCLELEKLLPNFFAVVPCRWENESLIGLRESGVENVFSRQTDWEYFYLSHATDISKHHKGCVIFWLPVKDHNHHGEYARDTRGELGRWGTRAALMDGHMVIGAEANFPGLSVIQRNLEIDLGMRPNEQFPIYSTLAETARQAANWVTQ